MFTQMVGMCAWVASVREFKSFWMICNKKLSQALQKKKNKKLEKKNFKNLKLKVFSKPYL